MVVAFVSDTARDPVRARLCRPTGT
jgi:hypothetical protein